MAARDRWSGHIRGTAIEHERGLRLAEWSRARLQVRPVQGNHLLCWQAAQRRGSRATSSVSGTAGRWRRPALSGRMWLVNRQEAGPLVTVVVRCNPVVRGPDVAPAWPARGHLSGQELAGSGGFWRSFAWLISSRRAWARTASLLSM